jgi:2-amino-4-hydroxy-6-hydroxymethyldihydropteridine diphosphokinase
MQNRNEKAFVALGANLGDPGRTLLEVMDIIEGSGRTPLLRSSLWRSAPVGCPPGSPDFINAVIGFKPAVDETPRSLLCYLQDLEAKFGRRQNGTLNAPRSLDLDIICFRDEIVNEADLVVPHPRATGRLFVLAPLAEIAPDLVLPSQCQSISELIENLPVQQNCSVDP